jgi:hypothetical protein
MMKELKKAQATFRLSKAEEAQPEPPHEEPELEASPQAPPAKEEEEKGADEPQPSARQQDAFSFKGIFGNKNKEAT